MFDNYFMTFDYCEACRICVPQISRYSSVEVNVCGSDLGIKIPIGKGGQEKRLRENGGDEVPNKKQRIVETGRYKGNLVFEEGCKRKLFLFVIWEGVEVIKYLFCVLVPSRKNVASTGFRHRM